MMLHTHMEPPVPPAEAKAEAEIESGTVISWDPQSGTGRILSDKDEQALFVHQCDISYTGEGKRRLPVFNQCEFQRSVVNGSDVASRVSRTHGRPYVFEKDKNAPEPSKNLPPPAEAKEGTEEGTVENVVLVEKLLQYQCRLTTNSTIQTGKVYFFHGEFQYGAIIPDNDTDLRIFADASSFNVIGSFLNVRKGLCVEYQTGKNSEGKEVATNVTGSGRKSIDHETQVQLIVPQKLGRKRKNTAQSGTAKKMKTMSGVDAKPVIPEGKNPISIFYEFANCCNPKRIPSVKLVSQNTRPSGMVSDFTFEARLDDKPIAQGRAKTKKDAKTYAAHYALEHLEKESAVYKQELARIKKGVPSVKKQMRNFTKRRWRPRFSGPGGNGLGNSMGNSMGNSANQYTPTNNSSASYIYQPAVVLANQIPAVSVTTYNPVNNTTSTSYMNQATAQKFVPSAAVKAKKPTATYAQPQPTYYSNQAYDANRYAAFGNYAQVQSSVSTAQYAARANPTATSVPTAHTSSNPWQNPVAAYSNAATQQVYQQQPQAYTYQQRKT